MELTSNRDIASDATRFKDIRGCGSGDSAGSVGGKYVVAVHHCPRVTWRSRTFLPSEGISIGDITVLEVVEDPVSLPVSDGAQHE